MSEYTIQKFPKTRIATIDVCAVGKKKHHMAALIEVDVTESREKIKQRKQKGETVSFTAWLIKVISLTIKKYEQAASYLKGKRKVVIFNDINVSMIVEKELNSHKIPIPLIIDKANRRSVESIATQIKEAQNKNLSDKDIVLHHKTSGLEKLYYILPGCARRFFWRYLIRHPRTAFRKMGNVSITSIGMMGKVNGWFIPISVHPICFGIGSITKKPLVVADKIAIREVLSMTVLLDHDVIDGANMARLIGELCENMTGGMEL